MTERRSTSRKTTPAAGREGWRGWDEYADFYDWENARTMGRRDVAYWRRFANAAGGPILELGCGTARVTAPLARSGASVVGVDRSIEMLARARRRMQRIRGAARRLICGDITELPFASGSFAAVIAPYGILQSLLSESALTRTLTSVVRTLLPGGRLGIELVPDVPRWQETKRSISLIGLEGPNGKPLTLIESVRQDRARRLTTFEHEFVTGTGRDRDVRKFNIVFRTLRVPAMLQRLKRVGLSIEGTFGGYHQEPWSEHAATWIITARKPAGRKSR